MTTLLLCGSIMLTPVLGSRRRGSQADYKDHPGFNVIDEIGNVLKSI